ncbi:MAG: hypothetical protein JWR44_1968, partial [Hymenobacter sp.]|nr:hypothetical protein [Hymenobacter sp.]
GLVLGTVAGLGSYYEASDETSLAWLFSGVLALKPVPSVPLYFHGWGHLLAAAYTAAPGVAWFGVLLGGLLGWATMLTFAVLDKLLRPHLRPGALVLALVTFYFVAWLEHWLWFSYVRVALLLAGASLLFAAQRLGRRGPLLLGLLGLAAAWLMRPSLGALAIGATLPAVLRLAGHWRRAVPLVACAALGLALASGAAAALQTPEAKHTQVRDGYFARILDFDQLRPQPRTTADSLGTAAVGLWLMGDSSVVSEALCQRAYGFDAADFYGREVPAKLWLRAALLVRDYFPILLALLVSGVIIFRLQGQNRIFWLLQLGFAGVLALFAGLLKLPPRLELPLLDFWLLTNLVFLLREKRTTALTSLSRAGLGMAALVVLGLYGAKTIHRRQVLGQERSRHEMALAEISRRTTGRFLVVAGSNDLLKSLSPFRCYSFGAEATLMLSGWPSHDHSQAALRRHLSGAAGQDECLRRLATAAQGTEWVLSRETALWLNRRFRYQPGVLSVPLLCPGASVVADTSLRFYQPYLR